MKSDISKLDNLKEQINNLLCFTHVEEIVSIPQGLSHTCCKVTAQGESYFVKYYGEDETLAQIESQLSVVAAKVGITPKVIYANNKWLVSVFVIGQPLSQMNIPLNDKLNHCLKLMADCHQLSFMAMNTDNLNGKNTINERLPALKKLDVANIINKLSIAANLTVVQQQVIDKTRELLVKQLPVESNYVCHGDINFSNVLLGEKAWLVDFECGCLADVEFDIAMMIAINELQGGGEGLSVDFVTEIYNTYSSKNIIASPFLVTRYLGFCYLINALWFFCKVKEYSVDCSDSKSNYLDLATKQFQYFDRLTLLPNSLALEMR